MPSTVPSNEPVARKESRQGMVTENFSSLPSGVPMVKTENGAQPSLVS